MAFQYQRYLFKNELDETVESVSSASEKYFIYNKLEYIFMESILNFKSKGDEIYSGSIPILEDLKDAISDKIINKISEINSKLGIDVKNNSLAIGHSKPGSWINFCVHHVQQK